MGSLLSTLSVTSPVSGLLTPFFFFSNVFWQQMSTSFFFGMYFTSVLVTKLRGSVNFNSAAGSVEQHLSNAPQTGRITVQTEEMLSLLCRLPNFLLWIMTLEFVCSRTSLGTLQCSRTGSKRILVLPPGVLQLQFTLDKNFDLFLWTVSGNEFKRIM